MSNKKMKFGAFLIFFSTSLYAHQSIQCSDPESSHQVVVNLEKGKNTLYFTNGSELPPEDQISILKDLYLIRADQMGHLYETQDEKVIDWVQVPFELIGKNSSSFSLLLGHRYLETGMSIERSMLCSSQVFSSTNPTEN